MLLFLPLPSDFLYILTVRVSKRVTKSNRAAPRRAAPRHVTSRRATDGTESCRPLSRRAPVRSGVQVDSLTGRVTTVGRSLRRPRCFYVLRGNAEHGRDVASLVFEVDSNAVLFNHARINNWQQAHVEFRTAASAVLHRRAVLRG